MRVDFNQMGMLKPFFTKNFLRLLDYFPWILINTKYSKICLDICLGKRISIAIAESVKIKEFFREWQTDELL